MHINNKKGSHELKI